MSNGPDKLYDIILICIRKEKCVMKNLLKGGKIYDGTGNDAYLGDILLEDDRILKVAPSIDETISDTVTDISGKSVSPGFIDCHSHNDWFAIKKDPLPYFDPFLRQGITTFITGNCGLSAIGFDKDTPFRGRAFRLQRPSLLRNTVKVLWTCIFSSVRNQTSRVV